MTSPYILTFSDPNNLNTITVLPVPAGPGVNTDATSLTLVGPGYKNYGLPIAQNFIKLLENFASPSQPLNSIKGQLWYDISNPNKPVLRINNGKITGARWPSANGIYQQTNDPVIKYTDSIIEGDIWIDTGNNQLKIRYSDEWTLVGPSLQAGNNKSGTESVLVESTTGAMFPVIKNWVNGKIIEIISYDSFTPKLVIDGFASIKVGTNVTTRVPARYNGIAEKASSLYVSPGVVINSYEVLKNNATLQIHTGTLYIESLGGLNVRPNRNSNSIKVYSDLTNSAFIDYQNSDSQSTFKLGIGSASYIKFNSGYNNIGINKSPTSTSPTLDVNGNGRFTSLSLIDTSTSALTVYGGASVGGKLTSRGLFVTGETTVTNTIKLGTTSSSGIILSPAIDSRYDIGSVLNKFRDIHGTDIYATTFHGSVTGSATSLASSREFRVRGHITSTNVVTFNGTATVTFATTLTRDAIATQPTTNITTVTQTLLVLNTSTTNSNLEKISKADFLSDVYPNILMPGMIIAFGTSTPPPGFLVCDGVSYATTSYPKLYSVIGTTYGIGGVGTFRTPNMTNSTQVITGNYITYIIKT